MKRDYSINPILNSVRQRLWRLNKNWIAAFVGDPGSGKSWAAIDVADYIESGKFIIDRVFFTVKDLLKAIDEGEIKKGMVVILDESGIAWRGRRFMSGENIDMSDLFQIMRYMNFALIMTVPTLDMIDKHGRSLCNMIFTTKGIDREEEVTICGVLHISHNRITGKVYPKFPRIMKDGHRLKADIMKIRKPRAELVKEYEKRKKAYGDSLVKEKRENAERRAAKRDEEAEGNHENNKKKYSCSKCGHEGRSSRVKPRCGDCNSSIVVVDKST